MATPAGPVRPAPAIKKHRPPKSKSAPPANSNNPKADKKTDNSDNKPTPPPPKTKGQKQRDYYAMVQRAARTVDEILARENIHCCVFGSLACKLNGNGRFPKDADILVLQPPATPNPLAAEDLKRLIVSKRPQNFYLKLPRDPTQPYRILWFRAWYRGPECKVDILTPGTLYLPHLPPERIDWLEGIPCMPFPVLLMQKLQSWDDHRKMAEQWKRKKAPMDAADLRRLLLLKRKMDPLTAKDKGMDPGKWMADRELFDNDEFLMLCKRRAKKYCEHHPDRAEKFAAIGFDVSPVDDPTTEEEGGEEQDGNSEGSEEGEEDDKFEDVPVDELEAAKTVEGQ